MELNYKEIGSRMAKRRKALGLKQYEVCEMINVNYKYISNLETGRSAPSLEVVMALCEALKTTPDYLLLGIESESDSVTVDNIAGKYSRLESRDKRIINRVLDILNEEK